MSIRQKGGVFGRNPTFNDVDVQGDLNVEGSFSINGEVLSGLDFEGTWNASTNTPDLTAITPSTGQFWIVSAAGTTDLDGITNWGVGDWALYDGTVWRRIEGGADGNFDDLAYTGTLTGGTGIVNIGSGQIYKDASGNIALGFTSPSARLHNAGSTILGSTTFGSNTTTKINISAGGIGYADFQNSAATASAVGRGNGIRFFSSSSVADMGRIEVVTDNAGDLTSGTLRIISSNQLNISANGVSVVYADGAGNTRMNQTVTVAGNLVIENSGNGIDFSATSGTGTSELFDDYEEGTYTATLTPASGSITVDANYNQLLYTKIGRTVHIQGNLRVSAISSPSGGVDLNLPFTAGGSATSGRNVGTVGFQNLGAFDAPLLLNGNSGTATAYFVSHAAGSRATVDGSAFTASPQTILFISMTYVAA